MVQQSIVRHLLFPAIPVLITFQHSKIAQSIANFDRHTVTGVVLKSDKEYLKAISEFQK